MKNKLKNKIKLKVISKLAHSEFFNFSFEVFSKAFDYVSPLTWSSYYCDSDSESNSIREKKFVLEYTANGLEKHLVNHLTSAADCNMHGDFTNRDSLINNYTYDLATASMLKIKLNPNLLESCYSTDLIMSDHLPNNGINTVHKDIFNLSKEDYANEVSKLFELESMNKLRVRGYVLGHNFRIPSDLESIHTLPASIIDVGYGNENVPVYSSPLFVRPLELFYFSKAVSGTVYFHLKNVEEIRDSFSKKTDVYQRKLTGVENPNSEEIRKSILECENFAKFLSY
ncbi:MAG: hypothetical protein HRU03_05775 [Nanoarchaeales archaeon]|nr:hypothetical protein [Nanoarchaeales archaeon]